MQQMTVVEIEALEKGISNCHCWVGGPSPFLPFFHIHECGWKFWALSVEAGSYCHAFHFEGHFGIAKDQTQYQFSPGILTPGKLPGKAV